MHTNMRDKIAGAVFGFAIGDAMGATTEFMSDRQIWRYFGQITDIVGGGWLKLNPGDVTDDTQMTMCIMDALMKYPDSQRKFKKACVDNFVLWYKSNPPDVGGQCSRGIQHFMLTNKYVTVDTSALGNGSLMRAMPCALLDKDKMNIIQGAITHNNSKCAQTILEYSRLIQDYLNNKTYTGNVKSLQRPSGHIVNTFNNAVYWSCSDTFKDAIIGAVNHGGDADTIAAITGSLAGARFGFSNIPPEWIEKLNPEVKIFLENFINFVFTYLQI